MKNNIKLFLGLLLFFILCGVIIWQVDLSHLSSNLKDSLISAIIGSGILGAIVSCSIYYFSDIKTFQITKGRLESYFQNILLPDLKEAIKRGPTIYNLSNLDRIYFDGSFINPFFDIYKDNLNEIQEYIAYFPDDELVNKYSEFYRNTKLGYINAERAKNHIYQKVREFHHNLKISSLNDFEACQFVTAVLLCDLSLKEISKHLDLLETPQRLQTLLHDLKIDKTTKDIVKSIKKTRDVLLDLSNKTVDIVNTKP